MSSASYKENLSSLELFALQQIPNTTIENSNLHLFQNKTIYIIARPDRFGQVAYDMLSAHAFATKNMALFGGACRCLDVSEHQYDKDRFKMELFREFGLSTILKFACPKHLSKNIIEQLRNNNNAKQILYNNTMEQLQNYGEAIIQNDLYRHENTRIFTPEYISYIQELLPPSPPEFSNAAQRIVVHLRRGDIHLCNKKYARRYLPDSYYLFLIQKYQSIYPNSVVTILSENCTVKGGDCISPEFNQYDLQLDIDIVPTWKYILYSDVVILSLSSFGIVPAIFNKKPNSTIVYSPFEFQPLPRWEVIPKNILKQYFAEADQLRAERNCT